MDFPFSSKSNMDVSYENKTLTYDEVVFPKEYNKTKKIGTIRPKTYFIKCDGNGHMDFTLLDDPINKLKQLSKLKDDGIITDEEFEEKKKKLLEMI